MPAPIGPLLRRTGGCSTAGRTARHGRERKMWVGSVQRFGIESHVGGVHDQCHRGLPRDHRAGHAPARRHRTQHRPGKVSRRLVRRTGPLLRQGGKVVQGQVLRTPDLQNLSPQRGVDHSHRHDRSDVVDRHEVDRVVTATEDQRPSRPAGRAGDQLQPQLDEGSRPDDGPASRTSPQVGLGGRFIWINSIGCCGEAPTIESSTTEAWAAEAAPTRLALPSRSTEAGVTPPGPAKPCTAETTVVMPSITGSRLKASRTSA